MADRSILDKVFPAAPQGVTARRRLPHGGGFEVRPEDIDKSGRGKRKDIKTLWASIYTLELRGFTQQQIAEVVNLRASSVARIVADERYIKYREERLSTLDQEFVAMKPLAFRALRGGLSSPDENTALRASEQWFKAANYGGFSKHERPAVSTSAEDIARSLLNQVNIQVNVSVPSADTTGED